jgi:hypothetical protein
MADPIAQDAPTFEQALSELVQALVEDGASPEEAASVAQEIVDPAPRSRLARQPAAPVRSYGLPSLPPLPANRLAGEARSTLSPDVDVVMEGLGLPTAAGRPLDIAYRLGSAGPQQVQKAQGAIGDAVADPSVANVANAGVQTGVATLRPMLTLGSAGAGYADALARDLGIFDTSAQAQGSKKKEAAPKMILPGLSKEQQALFDEATRKLQREDYDGPAGRRMLEETVRELRGLSMRHSEGQSTQERTTKDRAAASAHRLKPTKIPPYLSAIEERTQRVTLAVSTTDCVLHSILNGFLSTSTE